MNIFFVDRDPKVAAQCQFDKHVPKMVVETGQLASTAHRLLGQGNLTSFYAAAYVNHPCAVWVRQSVDHYNWLYAHFVALCDEYQSRYGKVHKTDERLRVALETPPAGIPLDAGWIDPPQCMPDQFKNPDDTVEAYRDYYQHGKEEWLHVWKRASGRPSWFG